MSRQLCFGGLKPEPPTIRSRRVAERIAKRIVAEVNLDEFYWTTKEVSDRIADVANEIARCGRPATVFARLWKRQPPISCNGERGAHPYGWEGIDERCRAIADEIASEELKKAMVQYERDY